MSVAVLGCNTFSAAQLEGLARSRSKGAGLGLEESDVRRLALVSVLGGVRRAYEERIDFVMP